MLGPREIVPAFNAHVYFRVGHWIATSVNFGEPLSIYKGCHDRDVDFARLEQAPRFVEVGRLANALMERIAVVVPVLPVPVLASVVREHRHDWESALAIKTCAPEKIERLRELDQPLAPAGPGISDTDTMVLLWRRKLSWARRHELAPERDIVRDFTAVRLWRRWR